MLGSLTPLGERSRGSNWAVTVGFYSAGAIAGGIILGGALGLLGSQLSPLASLPTAVTELSFGLLLLLGLGLDRRLFGLRLPTLKRQVDEHWMYRYRGWVYGGGFGLQLGLSVVTIVNSSAIYAALVAALLTASPLYGAIIIGVLASIRGLSALTVARITQPVQLRVLHRRLEALEQPTSVGLATAQLAISFVALAFGTHVLLQ